MIVSDNYFSNNSRRWNNGTEEMSPRTALVMVKLFGKIQEPKYAESETGN